ncbi:hypothetical protein DB347_03045 [Opitutaceae bacterium EW11]|nr:hypothetical protein DB347_03045 [Opitutaceae bacterium EW11]
MNLKLLPFLFATALLTPLWGQSISADDRPTLVARKTVDPIFPHRMEELGLSEGEVRIVISVDQEGKISEYLVIGYTHPALVDPSVAAIKRWEFEKPVFHGQPVSVQREMKFVFQNRGSVVSVDMGSFLDIYLGRLFPDRFVYRPRTLKEIDRIPTPLNATAPTLGASSIPKGQTGIAIVEFFIDETGAVRMPSLIHSDDANLGAVCAAAVSTWKFEPPTSQGRPVLVRAQQTFRFTP